MMHAIELFQKKRQYKYPEFDDPKKVKKILSPMPGLAEFEKEKEDVKSRRVKAWEKPFNQSPLLTREQEIHLFLQLNYFKYKANLAVEGCDIQNIPNAKLALFNSYYEKYCKVRNIIALANFKLTTVAFGKQNINFKFLTSEDFFSEMYVHMFHIIDYYDIRNTSNSKFCTFCVFSFKRKIQDLLKARKSLENTIFESDIVEYENYDYPDREHEEFSDFHYTKSLVNRLLEISPERKLLSTYFNLEGKTEGITLDKIAKKQKVTRQCICQRLEKAIVNLKKYVDKHRLKELSYE